MQGAIAGSAASEQLAAKLDEMNTMNTILQQANKCLAIMIFLSLVVSGACKKETTPPPDPGDNPPPGKELSTPVGQPEGDVETMLIGPGGGTFTAMDGAVSITIPAGAVNTNTQISVQRISNTNTAGTGPAWRIGPHQQFLKPVELTFAYDEAQISNTVPEALGVAFQDEKGVWQGTGGSINREQQKITVSTTHFSDWSLFRAFEIIPAIGVVDVGKSITLTVTNHTLDDELEIPMPGQTRPLGVQRDVVASLIREWKLNGAGSLKSSGRTAVYTAPNSIPAVNPVAVNVLLKGKGNKQYQLVCNIYIGREGISFRIGNGKWLHANVATGAVKAGDNLMIEGGVVVDGKPEGAVALVFKDKYSLRFFPWDLRFPFFMYAPGNTTVYRHFIAKPAKVEVSPGGIQFIQYSEQAGGYITGTFYLEKAGKQVNENNSTTWTPVRIDGFFRVKRSN